MFTIGGRRQVVQILVCTSLLCISWASAFGRAQNADATIQFQRDIAPIFQQSCAQCHGSAAMGKLRLDSEAAVLRGGASGAAISPGHSADSLLVKRLLGQTGGPRMPMG